MHVTCRCMYIYVYINVCVYVYVSVHVYVYVYLYVYIYIYTEMCVYIHDGCKHLGQIEQSVPTCVYVPQYTRPCICI